LIQSHYHALIEALSRKFKAAPALTSLLRGQFVTQVHSSIHTPYALFESVSARDLSLDGESCMELALQIHIVTDGTHLGQGEYGAELLTLALKDRQVTLDRPFRCADLWIEKLSFTRPKGPTNRATLQLKAIVETLNGV
jgi:hypothetical protein